MCFPKLSVDTRYLVSQHHYTQRRIAVKRRGLSSAHSVSAGLKATPRHAMPKPFLYRYPSNPKTPLQCKSYTGSHPSQKRQATMPPVPSSLSPSVPLPLQYSHHLLILRHPQPSINSRTKSRKTRASNSSRLRPTIPRKDRTRQTSRRNTIAHIILSPQALNTTLNTAKQRSHSRKVLGRAVRPLAHVF